MSRSLTLIALSALALSFTVSVRGQDSPSLGDLARQAQKDREKDKANRPAAKVLTNDDMPSSSASAASTSGGAPGQGAKSPLEKLAQMELLLDQVESLDKATLVRNVLNDKVDFPGRAKWEDRLFAAKQTYVAQARDLVQKARQIAASADSLKGNSDPNDPRLKEMSAKLQALVQEAVRTDSAFQAVMIEGRDLASQASGRPSN